MLAIILSFGAVDALIPLLIIIILIAAAAGLTRGWDALGKLFGISVLAGVGASAVAKGSMVKKSGFGKGKELAKAAPEKMGAALAGGVASRMAGSSEMEASLAGELAGMQPGVGAGAGVLPQEALPGAPTGKTTEAMVTGANARGTKTKFVNMAVKTAKGGLKVSAYVAAGMAGPLGVLALRGAQKTYQRRQERAGARQKPEMPLSQRMEEELNYLRSGGAKAGTAFEKEIAEAREKILVQRIKQLQAAKERYRSPLDEKHFRNEKQFRKEFKNVWRGVYGTPPSGLKLTGILLEGKRPSRSGMLRRQRIEERGRSVRERLVYAAARGARHKPQQTSASVIAGERSRRKSTVGYVLMPWLLPAYGHQKLVGSVRDRQIKWATPMAKAQVESHKKAQQQVRNLIKQMGYAKGIAEVYNRATPKAYKQVAGGVVKKIKGKK